MSLYRKYRPKIFKEILGQDHIVETLSGSLRSGNVSHAYLFSGTRGTGKTSTARILARELGCSEKDLYELDAASSGGVNEIRELCSGSRTLPFDSPKKVYIIDEVHMLSKEAFNALLKTLEEPPGHVVFILATTEPNKVPDTVVSRCQLFSFRKPTLRVLMKMLEDVATREGFELGKEAARLLSLLGDGSFRDAQVVLHQVISSISGKSVSVEDVERITGAPKIEMVHKMVEAILRVDIGECLGAASALEESSFDGKLFLKLVMADLRRVLLLRLAPNLRANISAEVADGEVDYLERLSAGQGTKILPNVLRALSAAYLELSKTPLSVLPIELALIDSLSSEESIQTLSS